MSGEIYVITSPSGKKYVGQCIKIRPNGRKWGHLERWKAHVRESQIINPKKAGCTYLNKAIVKYGYDTMKLELLEECQISTLDDRETYFIKILNTLAPNGYNLTSGGQGTKQMSEITKKLLSENRKGSKASIETRGKMRKSHLGLVHTEETKNLLRELAKRPRLFKPRDLPQYISYLNHKEYPGYSVRIPKQSAKVFRIHKDGRNLEETLRDAITYLNGKLEEKGSTAK